MDACSLRSLAVFLASSLLTVACSGGGSTPAEHPHQPPVASYATADSAGYVEVVGTTAYLGVSDFMGSRGKVHAVAIGDPLHPVTRNEIDLGGPVGAFGFSGGMMYVVHEGEAWGSRRLSELDAETLATTGRALDLSSGPSELVTDQGYAFIADEGGMTVVDLANLAVAADYNGASLSGRVFVAGNRAYLSGQNLALDVVDITTITAPQKVGSLVNGLVDGYPTSVLVMGTRAAIGCAGMGLAEVSLADEAHPALVRVDDTGEWAGAMALAGDLLLVANGDGVLVMDVTNPDAPVHRTTLQSKGGVSDVTVSGRYAYVTVGITTPGSFTTSGSLDVFDLAAWQ